MLSVGRLVTLLNRRGYAHKRAVVSLVERGRKVHVDRATKASVQPIVKANIDRESRLMTDESGIYSSMSKTFAEHLSVAYSASEYGRGDVYTNTVEGFFSIFKRGVKGIYQHCGEHHRHRYLAEYDFHYNNCCAFGIDDLARMNTALAQVKGKRLTYRRIRNQQKNRLTQTQIVHLRTR